MFVVSDIWTAGRATLTLSERRENTSTHSHKGVAVGATACRLLYTRPWCTLHKTIIGGLWLVYLFFFSSSWLLASTIFVILGHWAEFGRVLYRLFSNRRSLEKICLWGWWHTVYARVRAWKRVCAWLYKRRTILFLSVPSYCSCIHHSQCFAVLYTPLLTHFQVSPRPLLCRIVPSTNVKYTLGRLHIVSWQHSCRMNVYTPFQKM